MQIMHELLVMYKFEMSKITYGDGVMMSLCYLKYYITIQNLSSYPLNSIGVINVFIPNNYNFHKK